MKRLAVPFALQEKWYYCGPAALSLVAQFHGLSCSQARLAAMMGTNEAIGTTCAAMSRAARDIGLWVRESSQSDAPELHALLAAGIPCIIYTFEREAEDHGHGEADHFHFTVVTGFEGSDFTVHDTDPYLDGGTAHVRIPAAELRAKWCSEPGTHGRWLLAAAPTPRGAEWLAPRSKEVPHARTP